MFFFCALLVGKNPQSFKQVQLEEEAIKYLCVKSREIFLQQPVLLELEAPIKICGIQNAKPFFNNLPCHSGYFTITR